MDISEDRIKKEKSRVAKRIQGILLTCIALLIPVLIGHLIWANSFLTIVPPDKTKTFPDGAMLWSYWENRQDQIISPDFIQVMSMKTLIAITYNKVISDKKPLQLPYSKHIHEFVSGDIGGDKNEVIEPEKEVESEGLPGMKDMDDEGTWTMCSI